MATEYKVVSSNEVIPDFEKEVSKAIKDGWQPIGGIESHQLTVDAKMPDGTKGKLSMIMFLQAMVK